MSKKTPELEIAPGVSVVMDVDLWSLPLLEEAAAETRDIELAYLAGVVALRVHRGIDLEE